MIPTMCGLVFFSYRQGIKDGRALKEEKKLEPVVSAPKEKPKLTDEMKKLNIVLDNINNYNGGPAGQKVVK